MERRKESLIAACWANSNYDDDKGTRQGLISEIEEHFSEAIRAFLTGKRAGEEEEFEIDENNPFWSGMKRGVEKVQSAHRDTNADVKDVIYQEDFSRYIDQG